MAKFEMQHIEGMNYVDVHLENETIRAESGAMCYMIGDITVHSKLVPSVSGVIRSLMADEAVYRPTYTGTGLISLESSFGGFHMLDLQGESWLLEKVVYWV